MIASIVIAFIGLTILQLISRMPRWMQIAFWVIWLAAWGYLAVILLPGTWSALRS